MPPNQLKGITLLTPGTVAIRCRWATGKVNPSETACLVTRRSGFDASLPRLNSVRIVARVMIRNNETTRLEIESKVRRLLRRMFFRTNLAHFISAFPIFVVRGFTNKSNGECSNRHHRETNSTLQGQSHSCPTR